METGETISICVAAVLLFGILVGGITSCSVMQSREISRRVEAACAGDLRNDSARSAACAIAITTGGKGEPGR